MGENPEKWWRNWTLTANMTAKELERAIAEVFPGPIRPSVTGREFGSVTVASGPHHPPGWMLALKQKYRDANVEIR
jgi:hypothetical protein